MLSDKGRNVSERTYSFALRRSVASRYRSNVFKGTRLSASSHSDDTFNESDEHYQLPRKIFPLIVSKHNDNMDKQTSKRCSKKSKCLQIRNAAAFLQAVLR